MNWNYRLLRWLDADLSRLYLFPVSELQSVCDYRSPVSLLWRQCGCVERHRGGDSRAVPCFEKVRTWKPKNNDISIILSKHLNISIQSD